MTIYGAYAYGTVIAKHISSDASCTIRVETAGFAYTNVMNALKDQGVSAIALYADILGSTSAADGGVIVDGVTIYYTTAENVTGIVIKEGRSYFAKEYEVNVFKGMPISEIKQYIINECNITIIDKIEFYFDSSYTVIFDFETTSLTEGMTIYAAREKSTGIVIQVSPTCTYNVDIFVSIPTLEIEQYIIDTLSNSLDIIEFYLDEAKTIVFDFETTPLTESMTLYVTYEIATITVKNIGSGVSYTIRVDTVDNTDIYADAKAALEAQGVPVQSLYADKLGTTSAAASGVIVDGATIYYATLDEVTGIVITAGMFRRYNVDVFVSIPTQEIDQYIIDALSNSMDIIEFYLDNAKTIVFNFETTPLTEGMTLYVTTRT